MNKNFFAPTPPMGWNSYDYYDTTVRESQVKANADYMAAHLKEFGWEYIVVDIQWYAKGAGSQRKDFQYIPFDHLEMDEYGRLQPDPARFPSSADGRGFGPLAEYIHSLGLKFGIHIMRGIPRKAAQDHLPVPGTTETADRIADPSSICLWNPDMYGVRPGPAHIDRAWDYCRYANMWRITDDFWDNWNLLKAMFERCEKWQDHVKEGCYPDCDMLPLGWIGKGFEQERETHFTKDEQKTMMTLWCIFRSPLMVGAELTKLDEWTQSVLTNREVLGLLKTSCQGNQILRTERTAVWRSIDKQEGTLWAALFNLSDEPALISVDLKELLNPEEQEGLKEEGQKNLEKPGAGEWTSVILTELWEKETIRQDNGLIQSMVPAHGVKAYRICFKNPHAPGSGPATAS